MLSRVQLDRTQILRSNTDKDITFELDTALNTKLNQMFNNIFFKNQSNLPFVIRNIAVWFHTHPYILTCIMVWKSEKKIFLFCPNSKTPQVKILNITVNLHFHNMEPCVTISYRSVKSRFGVKKTRKIFLLCFCLMVWVITLKINPSLTFG